MPIPLIGMVVTPSPRRTNLVDMRGVYFTKSDWLPDMWWVVPLSIIILRDLDRRDEHGTVFTTRATTLLSGQTQQ